MTKIKRPEGGMEDLLKEIGGERRKDNFASNKNNIAKSDKSKIKTSLSYEPNKKKVTLTIGEYTYVYLDADFLPTYTKE